MSRFRRAWSSLKFYKEYLFGFETLVFATSSDLIYAQTACNTPKRKENLKLHHMTPLILCLVVTKLNRLEQSPSALSYINSDSGFRHWKLFSMISNGNINMFFSSHLLSSSLFNPSSPVKAVMYCCDQGNTTVIWFYMHFHLCVCIIFPMRTVEGREGEGVVWSLTGLFILFPFYLFNILPLCGEHLGSI